MGFFHPAHPVFFREGEKGKAGYKSSDAASKQGCGVELGLNCKQSSGDLDKCNLKFRQIQLCNLNKYIFRFKPTIFCDTALKQGLGAGLGLTSKQSVCDLDK